MEPFVVTRELATKVRDVVDAGLVSGLGQPTPGKMCIEAAVCFAMGLPHSDQPTCVSPSVRRLKIGLNDRPWSSPTARAQGLRRLAIAQLGTMGAINDREFLRRVIDVTIRKAVPMGLRAAASVNPTFAERLEAAAVRCEKEGTRGACEHARSEARAAYAAYAADAAAAAAYAAYAAYAAAYADAAAAAAYAADAADARARDRALAQYAEWIVEILIDLKAPGCQFLDLVETAA